MAAIAALLGGGLSAAGAPLFLGPGTALNPIWTITGGAALGGMVGYLVSLLLTGRIRFSIPRRQIFEQSRHLLTGESLLLMRAPTAGLEPAAEFLQAGTDTPPAVFWLPPDDAAGRPRALAPTWSAEALEPERLQEQARQLARRQPIAMHALHAPDLVRGLAQNRRRVQSMCHDLAAAAALQQTLPPAVEWLLDNEYILESNARDVLLNLPSEFYRRLPRVIGAEGQPEARVFSLARHLALSSELRIDDENIRAYLQAYQSEQALTIAELWAFPQMLRIFLIQSIEELAARAREDMRNQSTAACWASRLTVVYRHDPDRLYGLMSDFTASIPVPDPYFVLKLLDYLHDEPALLVIVQDWLVRSFRKSAGEVILQVRNRQTRDRVVIANAFTSLRQMTLMNWNETFEALNRVEQILSRDPAGIYPRMDFATRDRYRQVVEDFGSSTGLEETAIAERAVELAAAVGGGERSEEPADPAGAAKTPTDIPPEAHVGWFLIGPGRAFLARQTGHRESLRYRLLEWSRRHHSAVYFLGLVVANLTVVALAEWALAPWPFTWVEALFTGLLLMPAAQLAVDFVNAFIIRFFPPQVLPKMDYQDTGIPDYCRTLVVVPTLLESEESIRLEVEKLEIRYLANVENNLMFGLYSDFLDADTAQCETDDALLQTAKDRIRDLNSRYETNRFFLFHRDRQWSEGEQLFMGWERKRGKLEELNDLLAGTRPPEADPLVIVGDPQNLVDVPFVITLDSDTQLPTGAARRLIETISHPLNRARRKASGTAAECGRIEAGYTIIQPTIQSGVVGGNNTLFTRLFAQGSGIDPYPTAASDAYQDLTGEGSYHGKGIYDVRAFCNMLSGRFPEARLLSHDLIEGAHVRVGLASDIELYEDYPSDLWSYGKRRHRWIRGDWQIADWILPWVPQPNGRHGPNPLTWFNRWKIFDNLRRSLLPAGTLALLIGGWLISRQAALVATGLVAVQLLFHGLVEPVALAASRAEWRHLSSRRLGQDILRILVEATLLPFEATVALDAIIRVLYRRMISHRRLLQWISARRTEHLLQNRGSRLAWVLLRSTAFGVLVAITVGFLQPANLWLAWPWITVWCAAPLAGWWLSRPPSLPTQHPDLASEDRWFLERIARTTWRYFDDFVTAANQWLPPDNFQPAFAKGLALRTSPTNIGMYLVSVLGAHRFGFLTVDAVPQRIGHTLDTIDRLERYRGHLLNWYDIQSLAPLEPRYVSTVDSGNLLGALWTLHQGLQALTGQPVLDFSAWRGLEDNIRLLRLAITTATDSPVDSEPLSQILRAPPKAGADVAALLEVLQKAAPFIRELATRAETSPMGDREIVYWARQAHAQLSASLDIADRYLSWVPILRERSQGEIAEWQPAMADRYREALATAPSLREAAGGRGAAWLLYGALQTKLAGREAPWGEWLPRLKAALDRAQWLAGEMLAAAEKVSTRVQGLAAALHLDFLYHPKRRLFFIGFNVAENRPDRNFYDFLESEARLGSLVAIASNCVPVDHWFAMNRAYGKVGRRPALLSWNGTMFEYLMPYLFQKHIPHTLLEQAATTAVEAQIEFGRRHQIPWGISESAFADLDLEKSYQYRAFGVPELGLNRGLTARTVIAPYATLLALDLRPAEGLENLHRLDELGLLWHYGFYEALDYHRQPMAEKGAATVVRTYMAHHQGMCFLALTNFLHGDYLRNCFHADPQIRAIEPLLYERIPVRPPMHHIATRERAADIAITSEYAPAVSQFDTPHTGVPRVQVLSNGRFHLMVTAAGGGYSRWNQFDITRWRADVTMDPWGTFCYLRDLDSDRLWCNTYQPTRGEVEEYHVNFTLGGANFRRIDDEIETKSEMIVAPDDDVEIRRITLFNRSSRVRRIEVISYLELALSAHAQDRQHPAFNKLFVQTEALLDVEALLAWRRLRSPEEPSIYAGHRLTVEIDKEPGRLGELRFETDRRQFIGRGATLAAPASVAQPPSCSQGFVLDPIFSLRRTLRLEPRQRVHLSLVLAAADTRKKVLDLMTHYSDPRAIRRAAEFAWSAAQVELRLLHIQPDQARRFQQMAAHLIYPNSRLRAHPQRLAENRRGQPSLWGLAISGDLPIALLIVGEYAHLGLVQQLLQAHRYWRMHGLMADLVIINEEVAAYNQPLREELERLIHFHSATTGLNRPGGIFQLSAAKLSSEDLTLLRSAACLVMVGTRGTLPEQLATPASAPTAAPATPRRGAPVAAAPREWSPPLPFRELLYFNSLGGFTPDGREYAIYLAPGQQTPAPWINVIAGPQAGTLVGETGAGFTWHGNSQRNRLTEWSNDPVLDPPAEALYLHDEESRACWSPTAAVRRDEEAYRARHGAGYSAFEHNTHGIEHELTVFVPPDSAAGPPVKVQLLKVRNRSGRPRSLKLTYYVSWTLGESRETAYMHTVTNWDDGSQMLLAHNYYHPDYGSRVAFAALTAPVDSYTANRTSFLGRNGDVQLPAGLMADRLSGETGAGLDPCAALRCSIRLAPDETLEVACLLGQAATPEMAQIWVRQLRAEQAVQRALQRTQEWWDRRLSTIQVHTPELTADLLINRWLLYQTLSCRLWARSGFYQSGGAYGFRDQLQDVMALVYAEPELARDHLLRAASRQFREGDVQHWWHPSDGTGIRSRISDDQLWLPYALAHYVRVTGDTAVLQERVPFLEAPRLTRGQLESLQTPGVAPERANLFDHCRRAVQRSLKFGPQGLPLIGTGDWNDGMNQVGHQGRGESVWLGWFLVATLRSMEEMSATLGRDGLQATYQAERTRLIAQLEANGWDGEWYRRAQFDDGTPIGSRQNVECQIDSIPQAWAALTGGGDPARTAQALDSAWQRLVLESDRLALLLTPPFNQAQPSPGYLQGYPPGVRENGGQYTHAAVWLAMAFARQGDGTRAVKLLHLLNPIDNTREPDLMQRYGLEPYALAGDVHSMPSRIGRGGWSWYTGSAGWMYRAWVEEVLGLQIRGRRLRLAPVIPAAWDGFQIDYRYGGTTYAIQVENPAHVERGVTDVELDDQACGDGWVPLVDDGGSHHVRVRMGARSMSSAPTGHSSRTRLPPSPSPTEQNIPPAM